MIAKVFKVDSLPQVAYDKRMDGEGETMVVMDERRRACLAHQHTIKKQPQRLLEVISIVVLTYFDLLSFTCSAFPYAFLSSSLPYLLDACRQIYGRSMCMKMRYIEMMR